MWSDWLVFCDCDFQCVCPLMEKDKRLMEASWWKRLTEKKLGLVLIGGAMLSKSLIQFSVDGRGCVPSLLFTWGQTMVEVMKIMSTPSKGPMHACYTQCPQPCSMPHRLHRSLLDTHGQVWVSLLWGHCFFLLGPGAHKILFVPSNITASCTMPF